MPARTSQKQAHRQPSQHGEAGYTLVALMALMTVLAISLTAAAPIMKQQAQRERELEAIRRGEEVAEAIRLFHANTAPKRLPTSMKELIEGAPKGTKKVQVLRASAARDPLSEDGEWRLIRKSATNSTLCDFYAAIVKYNGDMPLQDNQVNAAFGFNPIQQCSVRGLSGGGFEESGAGEIIGVASRSTQSAVVTYFGIDKHSNWVFTPALPKMN